MALMIYLDDAMKVLLQNDFIDIGYIDNDGGSEIVRNELEQKCYLREPVDIVRCKDCKWFEMSRYGERGFCKNVELISRTTFYCADGERKPE